MKKVLLIGFVLLGFALQAQPGPDAEMKGRKETREKMADLTPEQRAELKTKKMALHLNLTEAQQKQMESVLIEREKKMDEFRTQRKEGKELSKDELFEKRSQKLDEEIAFKKEIQSILTEEQFAKFEKTRMARGKAKREHRKRKRDN